MALKTLGTAATNTLQAIQWNSAMSVTDLAALNALFKYQGTRVPTTFLPIPQVNQGVLYLGVRGQIRLAEGDWIGVDPVTGESVHINSASAAGASWVHS